MKSIAVVFFLLFSFKLYAFPEVPEIDLDAPLVELPERADYNFNGIVALSNCSAALVHFAGQPETSQAYVLSNGHCLGGIFGFPKPGEVRYKITDRRRMNVFVDINNRVRVRSVLLVYGTMTDTDVALFRLEKTYKELKKKGIESYEMSSASPSVMDDIQIISGYHRKGFECGVEAIVHSLKEGAWTMRNSIRYSDPGCEVYAGTSGSPVIKTGEKLVVGVNNTGNESGKKCTNNNPCEVNEQGDIKIIKGRGYGQQTYWFTTCLNEEFDIDLGIEGCLLPKP